MYISRILKLGKGFELFKKTKFKLHEKEFVKLIKQGQSPKFLFITCSDSRVVPHLITSANPGDLFVVSNAGNFVPPYDPNLKLNGIGASIQFAVKVLGVKDIIVCGHSHCGAITELYTGDEKKYELIDQWIQLGKEAKNIALNGMPESFTKEEAIRTIARLSVILQLEHVLSYPFVNELVKKEKLFLHGWFYTIESGEIDYYDPQEGKFIPLDSPPQ